MFLYYKKYNQFLSFKIDKIIIAKNIKIHPKSHPIYGVFEYYNTSYF